jgi:IS5 family transposase
LTVQEKAVTPPTDGKLLYAMQKALVREARSRGIEIKRPGLREARKRKVKHARLRHGLKHKAAKRVLRRMRTLLRRVERQVSTDFNRLDENLVNLLRMARTVRMQSRGLVTAKEKIYSVHAPEVECIGKGKPHKPWEFGVKVGLAATAKSCFVTAADTFPENPYDGATLERTIAQMERVTGVTPAIAAVDQGYKGKKYHPARTGIFVSNTVKLGGKLLRFIKRRSAIEPIIGHLKNERGMRRNRLLGELGDRINALLSAIAWNLAKIARHLARKARAYWRLLALLIKAQLVLARLRLDYRLPDLPEAA